MTTMSPAFKLHTHTSSSSTSAIFVRSHKTVQGSDTVSRTFGCWLRRCSIPLTLVRPRQRPSAPTERAESARVLWLVVQRTGIKMKAHVWHISLGLVKWKCFLCHVFNWVSFIYYQSKLSATISTTSYHLTFLYHTMRSEILGLFLITITNHCHLLAWRAQMFSISLVCFVLFSIKTSHLLLDFLDRKGSKQKNKQKNTPVSKTPMQTSSLKTAVWYYKSASE